MEVNPNSFFLLPSGGAVRFPNFTPSAPHHFLTLPFLWERLYLRLMQEALEGKMESSPSACLTTDSWKLTLDKDREAWVAWGSKSLVSFLLQRRLFIFGFWQFYYVWCAKVRFSLSLSSVVFLMLLQSCLISACFGKISAIIFSSILFLLSFWNPNCVRVQPFGIVPHISYTLFYIFQYSAPSPFSLAINSTDLSSSSLILSSLVSSLL